MRKIFSTIMVAAVCIFMTLLTSCQTEKKPTEFNILKGVNVGCWLSQSRIMDERRPEIFNEKDIELLAEKGFDHIRLPVDEVQLFHEDMTLNEETVELIHKTISSLNAKGIKVIFDLHIIRAFHFLDNDAILWKSPEEQEKLVNMWRTIQGLLKDYPVTDVAYEILNEAVAPTDEQWSDLMLRVVSMIRETEPDRIIVLGANMQNNVEHVKNIKVPEGDKNIMLSFHFYEPLLITHYQAGWTPLRILNFEGEMQYPGQLIPDSVYNKLNDEEKAVVEQYNNTYDKEWIRHTWSEAIAYAKEKGLRLFLGEFGCRINCGENVRLPWINDVVQLAQEYNIAYALWEYNHEFGFASRENKGEIRYPELLETILQ